MRRLNERNAKSTSTTVDEAGYRRSVSLACGGCASRRPSLEFYSYRCDGTFCRSHFPATMDEVCLPACGFVCRRFVRWALQTDVHCLCQLFDQRRHRYVDWRRAKAYTARRWHLSRLRAVLPHHEFRRLGHVPHLSKNGRRTSRLLRGGPSALLEYACRRRFLRRFALWRIRPWGASFRSPASGSGTVSLSPGQVRPDAIITGLTMPKDATETGVAPEIRAKYEVVIGLEVHVQLLTKTKIFCSCSAQFGDAPNTNTCPVCLGLPGTLPVLNKRAVEMGVRAALALNCTVNEHSRFARKNYFYPDLPKGYQISQYELPLAEHGWLDIEVGGEKKRIGITRLHLEDDAAKNLHEGFSQSATKGYIDYNRGGTPLAEIVSEPDMRSSDEAYAYLTTLRQIMLYTGVSDVNMEEGSLRCDANVSVRLRGTREFGTKVEVKNLNSFRFLQKALEFEIERHIGVLESGGRLSQETRFWNQAEGRTVSMRSKERAHDYRYFPEPDLLPIHVSSAWRDEVFRSLPELPEARRARFVSDFGLTPYDAAVLTSTPLLAEYFELVAKSTSGLPAKTAANWIQTELLRRLNELDLTPKDLLGFRVSPPHFASLLEMISGGQITAAIGKKIFGRMFETGQGPREIAAAEDLMQTFDLNEIEQAARDVIAKNPDNVAKFKSGNEGVFKFFVGQVMRATRGQANPQTVNDIL